MIDVLLKEENLDPDIHRGKTMRRDTGRRWPSKSQGMAEATKN